MCSLSHSLFLSLSLSLSLSLRHQDRGFDPKIMQNLPAIPDRILG